MKMSRQQLWLVVAVALLALAAGAAGDRGGREKRTLDLLLRGLAQALGYEVRPIKGRGVIPATDPPPRSTVAGGAPSGAQKDRETTTPSLPEPVTDPRVRPPYDVDDLLSYRGQQQHQQRQQGGTSPPAGPATAPAPPTTPAAAGPTPPPESSAISQFVRANAGALLNAEFDRTQLGRGPGGIRCKEEHALPELPHYPGYGPDFDSGPHLEFQKGPEQQRELDHSTESGGSSAPHQPSQSPGEHQHHPQDVSYTGQSYGGPGPQKVPTTGGQVEGEVPQVPVYNSADGGSKQPQDNFADILFGPLEQPGQAQQGQSAQGESDRDQPAPGGPDGGYFGVVLGAPLHYRPPPSEQQIVSRQNRHQAEREQEEVNHQGAYVGVIVQAPLHHGDQRHHQQHHHQGGQPDQHHHHQGGQPDQQHHHQAGPPEQAHGTQLQQQVHHRGPNSEHLFNQWASASPTVYPSLQPYIFSYTVPAWVSVSRRSDEAAEAPAQSHLSLLEEPLHATGRYFPQGAGGSSEPRAYFREEDLPEPLRLNRAEEEQEEEEEVAEEEEGEGQQEAEEQDYDEEAEQQDDTPTSPPPPPPPSPPPVPEAPRQRGPPASAAPGGSAPPPAAGSLLQQLPLPLPPASTHAPPMLQLLQQRQQPPPRGAGGGGDPGAGPPLGVGVGALWPPPPFDSAAAALASNNNDLLAATEKRAAELGKNSWGPRHHAPALWASSQLAVSPTPVAPRSVPSAEFPVHYSIAPLADYGAGAGLPTPPARLLTTPKASAAGVTLKAAPTPALELELELPWNFYTDPANHRHNFAFSSAGKQRPDAPGAAVAASSTPATWAVLDGPTKVYKRHAVAARSWAFHEDFVVLSNGDDDDEDSDGAHSQPAGASRAAPMTHSESFGSLWRDFISRLSDDGDDVEVAGSEESGAVSRPTRSGGWHLPTYHRDPLGYVSKYVPEDDDDAGFVGASSVLRTRVAEGRSEKLEEPQATPARADSKVDAVTWPSFNDPVLYGEALEKQQQQGQEQHSVQQPQEEAGQTGTTGTEYSREGLKSPPEHAGEDRGREVSAEKQPSSGVGAPNNETGKEVEAGEGAGKVDDGDAKREEFVPYFARPEHYRIRYQEPEEEEGASGASDQEQGSSQESGMAAARRKKPWYFKDPGPRYGGTRRRKHQQEGAAQQHRPQPQNHHQNHRHQPKHRGQQHQKQAQAEPNVWDYYGNPDNFYIPPDTISTIVIGKEEEEEGEDQGKGGGDPPAASPAPARERDRPRKNSRRRPAGRNSRDSDWPPAGFRSSTHHSRGSKGQATGPKAESTSTKHWSPHFAHENPYHSEYEYPKIEYKPQSASAADSASTAAASKDTYPWSLYTGSASHYFGSQKKEVPENAGGTARTEPPPKGTAVNSGKVTGKESAKDEGKAASKPATRGPDPLWHLAMRVLTHANAAGKAKAATSTAKTEASTGRDTSKNEVLTKVGSPSTSSASQPVAGDSNRGGTSGNIAPTNEYSWFSADTTFPSYEGSRTSAVTNPAATATSAAGRKQEDAATVGAGDDHWTQYTSPFSQNADTGVDAGSGSSAWRPESFFQEPTGLDYGRTDHSGPPSSRQHQAGPAGVPRQTSPPPLQQVSRTTTTSQSERETSAGALLGLFLPRILLPTSPPAAVAAAAAAPTAQEVLEAVRPQVRISVAPSAGGGVATVAAVEPVRYEFSTETTLLAPFSTGGLSKETVSRTSTLHLTGHFQVNPDDRGDADAPARPKSGIAAASAI